MMISRFVFFGQHATYAYHGLEALLSRSCRPSAVVVGLRQPNPDKPYEIFRFGSNDTFFPRLPSGPYDLRPLCDRHRIEVVETGNVNDVRVISLVARYYPEAIVAIGFHTLFNSRLLGVARMAALNVHPSLLPRWRGPVPYYWIFRTEEYGAAGATVHHMDPGEDHGPIICQAPVALTPEDTIGSYLAQAGALGGTMVANLFSSRTDEFPSGQPQDESASCRGARPSFNDLALRPLSQSAAALCRFINSVNDYYTLHLDLGHDRFYLLRAIEARPGKKLLGQYVLKGAELYLQTKDGILVCEVERSESIGEDSGKA